MADRPDSGPVVARRQRSRRRLLRRLAHYFPASRPAEAVSVILTAGLVGAMAGLAAVAFDVSVRLAGQQLQQIPAMLRTIVSGQTNNARVEPGAFTNILSVGDAAVSTDKNITASQIQLFAFYLFRC